MKSIWIKASSLALFSFAFFSSCVSTETVEPEPSKSMSKEIVLNLGTVPEVSTRAQEGYKLRYIAKIYQGSSSAAWEKHLDRKEIIDGESNNQIIFRVDPNADYGILVFADYIPSNYQADSNGLYNDYFYNTSKNSKRVMIRTTPGSDASAISTDFFNNPNYDAFYGLKKVHKDVTELKVDMTLSRITSQVIFRDNSDNTGNCSVKVSKLGVRRNFDLDIAQSTAPSSESCNVTFSQDISSQGNKDVFFFYSLADLINSPQNVSASFSVTNGEVTTETISATEIPVKSNYKTIVKGQFVPAPVRAGDIILNLSTDYNWQQEELSK